MRANLECATADGIITKGSITQRETVIGEELSRWSRQIFAVPRPMILPQMVAYSNERPSSEKVSLTGF